MENLIYGIIIGFLSFGWLVLTATVFYLYRSLDALADRTALTEVQIETNRKLIGDAEKSIYNHQSEYRLDKLNINNAFTAIGDRIKKLESIEVPEHLTLTQEITIQTEVEKRLAENRNLSDSNYLDNVRDLELAEHNRQYQRTE